MISPKDLSNGFKLIVHSIYQPNDIPLIITKDKIQIGEHINFNYINIKFLYEKIDHWNYYNIIFIDENNLEIKYRVEKEPFYEVKSKLVNEKRNNIINSI